MQLSEPQGLTSELQPSDLPERPRKKRGGDRLNDCDKSRTQLTSSRFGGTRYVGSNGRSYFSEHLSIIPLDEVLNSVGFRRKKDPARVCKRELQSRGQATSFAQDIPARQHENLSRRLMSEHPLRRKLQLHKELNLIPRYVKPGSILHIQLCIFSPSKRHSRDAFSYKSRRGSALTIHTDPQARVVRYELWQFYADYDKVSQR